MCDKLSYTPNDIFHQQSRKQEKTCFSRAQSHCGSQEKAVKCILIINSLSSMMELRCPAASHEILWHRFMQWCNSVCLQYIKLHLKVTCYPTTSTFTLTVIAANSWKDLPHDTWDACNCSSEEWSSPTRWSGAVEVGRRKCGWVCEAVVVLMEEVEQRVRSPQHLCGRLMTTEPRRERQTEKRGTLKQASAYSTASKVRPAWPLLGSCDINCACVRCCHQCGSYKMI